MNRLEIRSNVLASLADIAPEANPAVLAPNEDLRDALDIDSMDFLRFVVALHDRLKVDIPERDYPKVRTLDGCVEYLAAKLPS
jgi:acyl carrier protein